MVIAHAVNGEIALVDTGGDAGRVGQKQAQGKVPVRIVGILYAGDPAGAVGLGADDADISAHVQHIAISLLRKEIIRRPLGGVALAQGAYIDGR